MQGRISEMAKLAINGGEPAISGGLDTKWPVYGEGERDELLEVLKSGKWCSMDYIGGEKVSEFEEKFAEFIGTKYAFAVPNGTQALELAFRAIDLRPGDEVIVPAVSFISSASAVTLANGIPRFVDVEPETYQISPKAVESAINERTVAIEPVHYGGYPANMDRITEIAEKNDLFVIEDAAEAPGTEWKNEKVGSLGNMGCFSFQQSKPLTCGEGGCITCDDEGLGEKIRTLANLGRGKGEEKYKHYLPAGNFRMSEFLGAILSVQLPRFKEQTEMRHQNGKYFSEELEKIKGILTLRRDPRITKRGYYYYFLRYNPNEWNDVHRDEFMKALSAEGVPCSKAHNRPLYKNPAYRNIDEKFLHGREIDYSEINCPEAERIYESEVIALEKDFLMKRENVDEIVRAIKKIRQNIDELR